MIYSHTIYIPRTYTDVVDELTDGLTEVYGGCTVYDAGGMWKAGHKNYVTEAIRVINVITGYSHTPDHFMLAAAELKSRGEESVLMTQQGIDTKFE